MSTAHTPGPWHAETTPSSDFVTRRIYGPNDEKIADVGVPGRSNLDVHTEAANAALIAAAPELLAALVAMVRKYAPPDDGYSGDTPAHKARAAIAKAEGRS